MPPIETAAASAILDGLVKGVEQTALRDMQMQTMFRLGELHPQEMAATKLAEGRDHKIANELRDVIDEKLIDDGKEHGPEIQRETDILPGGSLVADTREAVVESYLKDTAIDGKLRPLHSGDLNEAFKQTGSDLSAYAENVYSQDPAFQAQVDRRAGQILQAREAGLPGNVDAALAQCKSNLSGQLAEHHVSDTLSPYFEKVDGQVRVDLEQGSFTKVDFHGEGARREMSFHDQFVPEGGSLRAEVKTGQPAYLDSQVDHMKTQAEGHQSADASITITSKDVVSVKNETLLRSELKDAGSPVYKFLPEKAAYDKAVIDLVLKKVSV